MEHRKLKKNVKFVIILKWISQFLQWRIICFFTKPFACSIDCFNLMKWIYRSRHDLEKSYRECSQKSCSDVFTIDKGKFILTYIGMSVCNVNVNSSKSTKYKCINENKGVKVQNDQPWANDMKELAFYPLEERSDIYSTCSLNNLHAEINNNAV